MKYYQKASFFDDVDSMVNLGVMYRNGQLPFDFEQSNYYLKKAVKLDNDKGFYNYAEMLCEKAQLGDYSDIENEKLYEEAAYYFKMAADMGNIEAGTQYGTLYALGLLHTNDWYEIIKYLLNSAFRGSFDAIISCGTALFKFFYHNYKYFLYILICLGLHLSLINSINTKISNSINIKNFDNQIEKDVLELLGVSKEEFNKRVDNMEDIDLNEDYNKLDMKLITFYAAKKCRERGLSDRKTYYIISQILRYKTHTTNFNNDLSKTIEDKFSLADSKNH